MEIKTKWEQRVWVVKIIYMLLISEYSKDYAIKLCLNSFNFDADQLKIIEEFYNNKEKIINLINTKISDNWDFHQFNCVDQAILFQTLLEYKLFRTPKPILIDQAIITAKNYSDDNSAKFINAILDKIL